MPNKTRARFWIKTRVAVNQQTRGLIEQIELWKAGRQAAHHIERALRMYAALLQGDPALLFEFFPQFIAAPTGSPSARPSRPTAAPVIKLAAADEAAQLDDLLDILGDIEL